MNSDRRRSAAWIGLAFWSCLLTLVVYGAALQLPFFFDDFVHIPFVTTHDLSEIWQTAMGLAYYRPLAFTLWKLMQLVWGFHSPAAQHGLNLLVHAGNGLMVGWLAAHLWPASSRGTLDWRRAFLSATLFLLYPFSYQAVPWVGSLAHPLVTALILGSLIGYLKWRAASNRIWGGISLLLAGLAPFAHENGALIGPFVALIEMTDTRQLEALRVRLWRAAIWTIPALLWLPVWWLIPKGLSGNVTPNGAEALLQNAAYFIQGMTYPVSWIGGWLYESQGISDLAAALGLGGLAIASVALVQRRGPADRRALRALLPWLWCLLSILPAMLFLPFDYVINGPRLLMLCAAGAAWLWTDVLLKLGDFGKTTLTRRASTALAVSLCLVLLAQNYEFIRARMNLHDLGGSVIRQVTSLTASTNEAEQAAVFINLPAWLALPRPTYAIGHEGVQLLPGYAPPEAIASVHTGQPASLKAIRFEAIRPAMPYLFGLRGQAFEWSELAQAGGQVFVAHYTPDSIDVEPAGQLAARKPAPEPVADFDHRVALLDASAVRGGTGLSITLTWQVHEPPPPDVTVFVHVLDAAGALIAQADGDPLAGSYPFWQWTPGLIVQDRRMIEVNHSAPSIRVGLYNRSTAERLMATSETGESWSDNAVPIFIVP